MRRRRMHPWSVGSPPGVGSRRPAAAALGAVAPALLVLLLAALPVAPAARAQEAAPGADEQAAAGEDDDGGAWERALLGLRVKTRLLEKLGSDALGIDVEVDAGEAVLRGTVSRRVTQELAEEAAKSVDGIARVDNRLEVRRPPAGSVKEGAGRAAGDFAKEVSDAELETRVHLRLFGEIGRYAVRLQVEAVDGVVSLRGKLPDRERKRLALRTARETRGVEKVIDLVEVAEKR